MWHAQGMASVTLASVLYCVLLCPQTFFLHEFKTAAAFLGVLHTVFRGSKGVLFRGRNSFPEMHQQTFCRFSLQGKGDSTVALD